MYAVIETGGKQYRVQERDVITIEKLKVKAGDVIEFDKVMILGDGKEVQVGTPYLAETKVFGSVVENGKAEKVIIFKYKSKKDYRKKQGHRQPYTMVEITSLTGEAKDPTPKSVAKTIEAAPEKVKVSAKSTAAAAKAKAPTKAKVPAKAPTKAKVPAKAKPKAPVEKKTTAKKAVTAKKTVVKKAATKKPAAK